MVIRRNRLRVAFQWVPRDSNKVADAVGRAAREANARVHWRGQDTDALVQRFFKSASKSREETTAEVAATGLERARASESGPDSEAELELRPVRVRRQRGRPRHRDAQRARPDSSVVSAVCRCFRCDREIPAAEVCVALPVFC